MLDLMAVGQGEGSVPLYMHTVQRILRNMRLEQQETGLPFDYHLFKNRVMDADLLVSQLEPLKQRLDTLESFMPREQVPALGAFRKKGLKAGRWGSDWNPEVRNFCFCDPDPS